MLTMHAHGVQPWTQAARAAVSRRAEQRRRALKSSPHTCLSTLVEDLRVMCLDKLGVFPLPSAANGRPSASPRRGGRCYASGRTQDRACHGYSGRLPRRDAIHSVAGALSDYAWSLHGAPDCVALDQCEWSSRQSSYRACERLLQQSAIAGTLFRTADVPRATQLCRAQAYA